MRSFSVAPRLLGSLLLVLAACDALSGRPDAPPSGVTLPPPTGFAGGRRMSPPAGPVDTPPPRTFPPRQEDAGAGQACVPARCPNAPELRFHDLGGRLESWTPSACCIGADANQPWVGAPELLGTCGVLFPDAYSFDVDAECEPIVGGMPDDACLDTVVEGEVIEGCRRPDGRCGHQTPGWGCHTIFRFYWDSNIDYAMPPNPFNCTPSGDPCTRSSQCCSHPNYGNVCWPHDDADELDAGDDEDAGLGVGYCEYSEYVGNQPSPFPH